MAALQTEGCQGTDKKEEPSKGHSRNGSIEKYFFKKKTDSSENDIKENGSDNVHNEVSDKNSEDVKPETPSIISSDVDKIEQTNVEKTKSKDNEVNTGIINSSDNDCDKENALTATVDNDSDKQIVKALKNDNTKLDLSKQSEMTEEIQSSESSGNSSEKIVDFKMADSVENTDSSKMADNCSPQTGERTDKLIDPVKHLKNTEETIAKDLLEQNPIVYDPVKDVNKNLTLNKVVHRKSEMSRPKNKQKARKSSKPLREALASSFIKTVNLAPIANVKFTLPDIESALNLCPKPENSKIVVVKKPIIQDINPPKTDPSPLSIPPAQESSGQSKLSPGKRVAMNARSRQQRKRIRRWGKGDLPLKKSKKKRPVHIISDSLCEPVSEKSFTSNEPNVKNDLSDRPVKKTEFLNCTKKSHQNLGIRHKASPTIVQLLTKHRPKLSSKNLSLLRAKKRKVSRSERTGKTVAELLRENLRLQISKENNLKNGSSTYEARVCKPSTVKREGMSLLRSPGIGCGRRVSLRKRKPTEEENGDESTDGDSCYGNTSTVMTTPSSGSKKRKMCTPGRVMTGGEKWQNSEDYDIPEADQGTRESPDLPPSTISSITTVTRSDDGTSPSVNVAISLDPAVITVADISANATKNNAEVEKKLQNEQSGHSSKIQNSTLRSVLLDPTIYSHPLLGRKSAISLLSGKSIHGSNGAIYPVTPSKLDVTSDGALYPRPASAPGVGSSSPPQRDVIPLCCCKITGACVSRPAKPVVYCQALDSVDGKVMGCCNKVSTPQLVRPAVKIPFMAVCEVHRKRLRLHQCCPCCGHFCTQGLFYQCRKEGGSSIHHFHKGCQVFKNGKYFCPHCGEESLQYEVNLRLNEPRHMTKFGKAEQELRLTLSRAKMAVTAIAQRTQDSELSENVATATYTVEGSNKEFSTAGLPFGPDRYSLERILYLMPQDRPKKYRVLPKCMHGPAKEADLDKVVYMLVDGYDPNEKFPEFDGQTGLHAAGIGGCLPAVHVLVQAGADVNCIDNLLKTPLMYASENNHLPVLKYLIRSGASVHSRGEDGMTCLHLAAKAGHIDIMRHLLQHSEIDINVQDDGGWTPIIWAAEHRHASSVKFLLSLGANPNLKDKEENTGLHWAAFSGSVDIAEIFLNAGCDIESPNEHGDRPLHIAARQDHYECVVLILARGGDVEARNNENEPAIGCCLDQTSQVWMALRVNRQLKGFAAKRLGKTERLIHRDITLGKENNPIPGVNCVDDADHPTDYLYVTENCETTPLNINRTITSLQSCGCKDNCSSIACNCSRNSVKCWFDKDGRLLPEFNSLEPPLIFECNRACRCWTTCNNRVVQNGITCRLQLFRTCGRGWGVKALLDIPPGSFICEYIGELISDSEADRREDDSYLFDLDNKDGETYCIDARKYGNVARFINHLCEPNIIPVKVFVEHQDLRFPRICFYSSRPIKAQEELGFDYGEKFWMIKWKQFTCACGSPKCKYSSETIHKTLEEYKLRHEDDDTLRE